MKKETATLILALVVLTATLVLAFIIQRSEPINNINTDKYEKRN